MIIRFFFSFLVLFVGLAQSYYLIEKVYDSSDCSGNVSVIISSLAYEDCTSQASKCEKTKYEGSGVTVSSEKICFTETNGHEYAKNIFAKDDPFMGYAGFAYYTDLGCRTESSLQLVRLDGKCHTTTKHTSYKFASDSNQYLQYSEPNCTLSCKNKPKIIIVIELKM